ncbi:MAG: hypothetical protein OEZ04_03835 [Nitrospinota bacterium]|nr:hypothetical protein [Nitrospinota bacterium]
MDRIVTERLQPNDTQVVKNNNMERFVPINSTIAGFSFLGNPATKAAFLKNLPIRRYLATFLFIWRLSAVA